MSRGAQTNAAFSPVRTLLDAAPQRGVARNDFLGSLLHGMIASDAHAPRATKYDVVSAVALTSRARPAHVSAAATLCLD